MMNCYSPGVERHAQGFLDALAAGGGKPLEQLSPADARVVLIGVQAGASLQSWPARYRVSWTAFRLRLPLDGAQARRRKKASGTRWNPVHFG